MILSLAFLSVSTGSFFFAEEDLFTFFFSDDCLLLLKLLPEIDEDRLRNLFSVVGISGFGVCFFIVLVTGKGAGDTIFKFL